MKDKNVLILILHFIRVQKKRFPFWTKSHLWYLNVNLWSVAQKLCFSDWVESYWTGNGQPTQASLNLLV